MSAPVNMLHVCEQSETPCTHAWVHLTFSGLLSLTSGDEGGCESCPDDHQYRRIREEIGRLH